MCRPRHRFVLAMFERAIRILPTSMSILIAVLSCGTPGERSRTQADGRRLLEAASARSPVVAAVIPARPCKAREAYGRQRTMAADRTICDGYTTCLLIARRVVIHGFGRTGDGGRPAWHQPDIVAFARELLAV